ncbi:tricorn protease [Hydrobacter penzbergensis]|uniref:Tricorn protease homolog n=1 Tax=Hydrobacter penzbergensis TaxID=1235997 RepID=A0A8X8IEF7_9BACT|nr:S41 family peptidase [Hydrobacter penzbergensis]SDW39390.1 tricorn protease [Hydrobacter penzbergensis]
MQLRKHLLGLGVCLLLVLPVSLFAIDTHNTRMLSQPAISANHIAFIYAEDLWVANLDGSQPRRLTVDEGIESNPVFSPDGKLIAFSAQYDGNTDVFVVPVEGGVPKRLTWHPGIDIVRGFTPDGKNVLFISKRAVFTNRYAQLFTVPVTGGYPTQLEIPNAFHATYSPDGKFMAYTPIAEAFRQWKHYRGGTISTISIFSFANKSVVKIPQPEEGCNDTEPMWIEDKIYFLSDRNGEFNLYAYTIASKEIKQLTAYKDFPIIHASAGNGKIVFEQAGYLHHFDLAANAPKDITVGIATDLLELRQRFAKGGRYIRSADISPSGNRAVFDFRGEIMTVPAEKGDARNITETDNAHEKYPAWSPDGKSIAYFSDASGEYTLHIKPQDGSGTARALKLNGTGFYANIHWSPDSKKICFADNGRNLYLLDVASGNQQKIDADELYVPGAFREQFGDWSPDSKWLVYTKVTGTFFKKAILYSVDQNKSFPVTDGLSDVSEPIFDRGGKYLFFFASTDAGPVVNWFDQSNNDTRSTNSIYLLTLQKETISPFAKESDEETKGQDTAKAGKKTTETFRIDLDGIQERTIDIPLKAGNYHGLGMGKEGELLYVVYGYDGAAGMLHKYDIKKRKDNEVMELDGYIIAADGKKMLYNKSGAWGIAPTGDKPEPGKGMLNTADLQVKFDPLAEWPQIFDEAWRINRDYFYDPGMHGVDWAATKKKYAQFLPDLSCRSDLNTLIQWMCSELAIGHHRLTAFGERRMNPAVVNGGLLGADFAIANNRYQLKKIYGGLNWNPNLRSPLTEPGVNAKTGEYILAVNGKDVTATENIFQFFEATAGKIVTLTIGPNPDYTGSRTVKVVPVENETDLRNRDWVEGNLKKVEEATKGQVAYVYVPNTAGLGFEYFKRYFFPQANKKAIIIDERFNGGGQLADYYIDILQRPLQAYWHTRYGNDLKSPSASIQGPKVMLIDETAGSGGDMLPWMFRKFKVGTLVGKRTWGGLVGILGFPEFMDGGGVTAPNVGIWTKDGFVVENVGVAPDIEVEQTPSEVIKGNDPQLQKAIEVAMKELQQHPQEAPQRPPFPVKVKK